MHYNIALLPKKSNCKGAFTPDANDANKSRYSREVGRLNILSLLEIRAIPA